MLFEMKKTGPPSLTIVPSPGATPLEPPRPLGVHGRRLWDQADAEYDVSDAAGIEMLAQACTMLDRAEALTGASSVKENSSGPRVR
jgi:hypothetical protein